MIREVSTQDSLQPSADHRHRFVPPSVQDAPDRRQGRPHPLLHRQSMNLELSLLVGSTTVGEPKKVKRLRPSLLPYSTPLGRKAAKLDQSRFVGMQSKPELSEPFPELIQESSRRSNILKAHHTVVGIANYDDVSLPWPFSPVLNPEIEGVVQIDVR